MSEVQVNTLTSYSGAGLDIREDVHIDDSGTGSGNLTVDGATTLTGDLTCTAAATVGTTLGVTGTSTLAGVTASGTVAANSDMTVASGITVAAGGADITGTTAITGAATVSSTLDVTGDTTVAALACDSLLVDGEAIGTSVIVGAWYGTADLKCEDDGSGGTAWSFTDVTETRSYGGVTGTLAGGLILVSGINQADTNYIPLVIGPTVTISALAATTLTLTAAGLVAANTTNDAENYTETVHMALLILDL